MGWNPLLMPPESGSHYSIYQWAQQFPDAIRERYALGNCSFNWPPSTKVHGVDFRNGGLIDSIDDNEDGTLTINCLNDFDGGEPVSFIWIGVRHPGDDPSTKFWTNYSPPEDFPYEPSFYRVAIYPPIIPHGEGSDGGGASGCDPSLAHVFEIADNGDSSLIVTDDGVLTLNGKSLEDYHGYRFEIIKSGVSDQAGWGYSWCQRYPPKPNEPWVDYGFVDDNSELASDHFTDTRDDPDLFSTPKRWEVDQFAGSDPYEVIFQVGSKWVRTTITGNTADGLDFDDVGAEPNANGYYVIVPEGAFWRPHQFQTNLSFPHFRTELTKQITPSGAEWIANTGVSWCPQNWYSTTAYDYTHKSHAPTDDSVITYGVPKELQTIAECSVADCDCDVYAPEGGKSDEPVFDRDLTTLAENFCHQYADFMFSPFLYFSLRGWQLAAEGLCTSFIQKKDYSGLESIPWLTPATWFRVHTSANTRAVEITDVDGGAAVFDPVTMPTATEAQGKYLYLDCDYTLLDAKGEVEDSFTGLLYAVGSDEDATEFSMSAHGTDEVPITDFDEDDIGKTLIISYRWTRKYERMVRYLYPRTVFIPDEDEEGPVFPPNAEHPGSYRTNDVSTSPCEFTEKGVLEDAPIPFYDGEAYRYVADHVDCPTDFDEYEDLLFQGVPSPTSNFPRWTKTGSATGGDTFYLEDTSNSFWVSGTSLKVHTGTGTVGSNTTTLFDSTKTTDGFWLSESGRRLVGMILEVEIDPIGNPGVYEKRVITDMSMAGTIPACALVVDLAFSSSTHNKDYRVREPGYSARGAIRDTFKDRLLTITKSDGESRTVLITASDDFSLYFNDGDLGEGSDEFIIEAGDSYLIDEIDPGSVVHYKNNSDGEGFVRPEEAEQDTRSGGDQHDWFLGAAGMKKNCPTIVTNYGRLRKFDIITYHYWLELYRGIDCLRWQKNDFSYVACPCPDCEEDCDNCGDESGDEECEAINAETKSGFPGDAGTSYWSEDTCTPGSGTAPITDAGSAEDNFNCVFGLAYEIFKNGGGISNPGAWEDPDNVIGLGGGIPYTAVECVATGGAEGYDDSVGGALRVEASAENAWGKFVQPCSAKLFSYEVDFWIYPQIDDEDNPEQLTPGPTEPFGWIGYRTFDSDFTGGSFQFHEYKKVETVSGTLNSAEVLYTTHKIGRDMSETAPTLSAPPFPGDYPEMDVVNHTATTAIYRGAWLGTRTAVMRWDVDGGLNYVS